jgi:hypothetical protein
MATVFTSSLSPFCCVLQTFLDYEGIAYVKVEVDPWRKTVLETAVGRKPLLPVLVFAGGVSVSKAQEIIDAVQEARGPGKCGKFSVPMKNQCMRINERVLPLVALNRHLTLASSHETVRYIAEGVFNQYFSLYIFMFF